METAVITTGGLGTREATITKSNPKTMLPVYTNSNYDTDPVLKPIIELIFDGLFDNGFRRFCIIVSSNHKNIIKNHLTPDEAFLELLSKRNAYHDKRFVKILSKLYKKINRSEIVWVNQKTPMGFGHALLSAKKFVENDNFLLHAGDTYFPSYEFLSRFVKFFKTDKKITCNLLLESKKLLDGYGIAQIKRQNGYNIVFNVEEKPKKPKSNLAILPVYAFKPVIFDALKKTNHGYNSELQVTDAIRTMIDNNEKITAMKIKQKWFDIGTPQRYLDALNYSFKVKHWYYNDFIALMTTSCSLDVIPV